MDIKKLSWDSFKLKFHPSWHSKMQEIIESPEMWEIFQVLKAEKKKVVPESKNVFKSFEIDLDTIKVISIGQSPYPKMVFSNYQSNGIAFDCRNYGKVSPSLFRLYEAWEDDVYDGINLGFDHNNLSLQYLVDQGVMLTNAALTCCKDEPSSHIDLWKPFWKLVFEKIFSYKSGLIFHLYGKDAQELEDYADPLIHHVFKVEHPAAASYSKRKMKHENIFSKTNKLLKEMNGDSYTIDWLPSDCPF